MDDDDKNYNIAMMTRIVTAMIVMLITTIVTLIALLFVIRIIRITLTIIMTSLIIQRTAIISMIPIIP